MEISIKVSRQRWMIFDTTFIYIKVIKKYDNWSKKRICFYQLKNYIR